MIAPRKPVRRKKSRPAWHAAFLAMLPDIRRQAGYAFRHLKPEAREDAVEEVVANACCAFARLVERDKADVACPSSLTGYGIKQYRDGRRVGNRLRIGDVLSPYAQRKKGIVVEQLDKFDKEDGQWIEAVVEDDRTPVPDQAAFRIDFPAWLATYPKRTHRIAESLAVGERTGQVAEEFGISAGRVSQMRQEFYHGWQEFHGEKSHEEADAVGVS